MLLHYFLPRGYAAALVLAACLHSSAVYCQSVILGGSGSGSGDYSTLSPEQSASPTIPFPSPTQTAVNIISSSNPPLPTPTPLLEPVYEDPVMTYGNNTCEPFHAGGSCTQTLSPFPLILTNLSRSVQAEATGSIETVVGALHQFQAPQHCFLSAVPLLCRYSFPTCDPAYRVPTYQPICHRDCVIVRDFLCREPWQEMLRLLDLLSFDYLDTPDCDPLEDTEAGDAPMCISTLNKEFIPLPLLTGPDCYNGRGRGYQGTINVTRTGKTCQPWSSTYPHQHLLPYESYPELSGGHNYCRNPGERGERPWCFTMDRAVRWEYCDVQQCAAGPTCTPHTSSVCRMQGTIGMDWIYLDTSQTDREDLELNMEKVLNHTAVTGAYSPACARILNEYICVSNFPTCDLSHPSPRPVMPCRQFCSRVLEVCMDEIRGLRSFTDLLREVQVTFDCDRLPEPSGGQAPECYEQNAATLGLAQDSSVSVSGCYNSSDNGRSYRGTLNVTTSGIPCQAWVSRVPHPHPVTPLERPELEGHNYCRNPDGRGLLPWCYTTDPETRWEYCDITTCGTTLLELPIYAYALIGVGAALLVSCLLITICCCCICCCRRRRKSKQLPTRLEAVHNSYNAVTLTSNKKPLKSCDGVTDNPLYAVNPLNQQPVEYDGIKLPEVPRENIFYIKDLGQGHFGVVVQAEVLGIEGGKDRSVVAIKVLKEGASSQTKKEFFREATLMHTFDHPNILTLIGVCIDQEPLCMVFEYMELGDLNNFLRQNPPHNNKTTSGSNPSLNRTGAAAKSSLSAHQLVCVAIDVASGLDYLAQNRFVHRDLATRNCLVSRSLLVKISDFGLSQDIYATDYFKMGDTELLPIRWMPPEAILYAKFTTQSDIWSFGVVLWEIFSYGIQPYFSMTNEEVVHHVRGGNIMSCPDGCPQEIYDLMIDCWAMEPADRPTASEIRAGLQRWSPDLSSSMQNGNETRKPQIDYQNMATIREYAAAEGGVGGAPGGEMLGNGAVFELSLTDTSMDVEEGSSLGRSKDKVTVV